MRFNYKKLIILSMLMITTNSYTDSYSDITQNLNITMQSMCKAQQFSGTVLIASGNTILFEKSCGLANRVFNVPNNLQTKFNLGSAGKLFTSVAIAQLIQQHKLELSTPIYKLIPSWLPNTAQAKMITVNQLLTHTSGLGNYMDDKRWKLGADSGLYRNVSDYKPLITRDHLLFSPGTSQSYSNNGYVLLGAIIEATAHTSYENYLNKNIFQPSGMLDTGIWGLDEIIPNRAEGYYQVCLKGQCTWKNNNFEAPFIGSPAGGAYSTIEDLYKFSQHLHHFKLLNNDLTQQVLATDIQHSSSDIKIKPYKINNTIIPEDFSPYGFAGAWNKFGLAIWNNPLLIGHTGGIEGASAFFATTPNDQYTIIILSNESSPGAIELYRNIRKILNFKPEITNY